jgi:hypothetical protein
LLPVLPFTKYCSRRCVYDVAAPYMTTPTPTMPYVHWWMDCQNPDCAQPIPLPDPNSPSKASNQAALTDSWKRVFLCTQCVHCYEYSRKHIQMGPQETQSCWDNGSCQCYSIHFECDFGTCGTPVELFAVWENWSKSVSIQQVHQAVYHLLHPARLHFFCSNRTLEHRPSVPDPEPTVRVASCEFPY